jgi:hypothetical protein
METRHIQDEPVRAYLLGTLDDRHAVALEEKYFLDHEFFGRVRKVETKLIEDFLQDRLSAGERRLFEQRYLAVPQLAQRVEELREEFAKAPRPVQAPRSLVWRWSMAGVAVSLMLVAGVAYWRIPRQTTAHEAVLTHVARNLPLFTVRLTPGLIKGANAQSVVLATHPAGTVRLLLDLPGRNASTDYQVQLMAVGAEGQRTGIWKSGTIRPAMVAGGSVLTVDVDAGLLRPGDYLAEAELPGGEVLETYLFHVNTAY